jgi:hypothetical protein
VKIIIENTMTKRSTFFIAEVGEERTFFLVPKRRGAATNGWPAVGTTPRFACRPLLLTVRAFSASRSRAVPKLDLFRDAHYISPQNPLRPALHAFCCRIND